MKILCIFGYAKLGKDGVGDYNSRFCREYFSTRYRPNILSLCYYKIAYLTADYHEREATKVFANRIPLGESNILMRL